jgi:hypothetical protein
LSKFWQAKNISAPNSINLICIPLISWICYVISAVSFVYVWMFDYAVELKWEFIYNSTRSCVLIDAIIFLSTVLINRTTSIVHVHTWSYSSATWYNHLTSISFKCSIPHLLTRFL